MADDAVLKLTFRLVPADDRPADPVVLDDIVRLIKQAIATAPKETPQVAEPPDGFRKPGDDEARDLRGLESRIESRIQADSAKSVAAISKRAETAKQPDGEQKIAEEARRAAELVVSTVQSAMLRRVVVRVPDDPPAGTT